MFDIIPRSSQPHYERVLSSPIAPQLIERGKSNGYLQLAEFLERRLEEAA